MEIELIQDGKGVDYNKYRDVIENVKESLFRRNMGKETKEWIYISNFVGILFDKNRLILSLPKSVIIKEDVDKETLLYKYARLFDLYFMVIDKNTFSFFDNLFLFMISFLFAYRIPMISIIFCIINIYFFI